MLRRRAFAPGDPIADFTADDYNALARELERLAKLSASSPLTLSRGAGGRVLGLARPEAFYARLGGSSSPYSWTEVIPQGGGTWFTASRTGTGSAHEVNGTAGLDSQVVRLTPTAANDYRFQWIRLGGSPCAGTTRICATVTDGCTPPGAAYGATVTVFDSDGHTVGSCLTDNSGTCCIAVPKNGRYPVTASLPGATTLSQSVAVSCDNDNFASFSFPANTIGTVCVHCTYCSDDSGNHPQPGVAVSLNGAGTTSSTTDGSGNACFRVRAGSYSTTVAYPTGFTKTFSITVTGCATTTVNVAATAYTYFSIFFGVPGCVVTWILKDPRGATLGTCQITVDAFGNGNCSISYPDQDAASIGSASFTTSGTSWAGANTSPFTFNCYTSNTPYAVGLQDGGGTPRC